MTEKFQKITVRPRGPYLVRGGIPLVRKAPIMSEHGEPLDWENQGALDAGDVYRLCRCGQSNNKPFCYGTHTLVEFDGAETAETSVIADRYANHEGAGVVIKADMGLCVHAGFCGNRLTNVWKMIEQTEDLQVRSELTAMIQRCPSGALSYSLEADTEVFEPDLRKEVAVVPDGPLWVSGGIPVERRDGQPLEARNRVTLCRCGASSKKPLCDGTHKDIGFSAP